tara:strand:+ start:77 stop:259 length:183 start_codon:yes stop_codon:yes gene_type:complete
VGVGSARVRILSELIINVSSFVTPVKKGDKTVVPDCVSIQKGLTNWQSGSPGIDAATSST